MIKDYVVIDFETSGLNPRTDRIIEIGVLVVRDGTPGLAESLLVEYTEAEPLSARTTEITGIKQADLVDGTPIRAALTWMLDTVDGLPLVGHNILQFDMDFLLWELQRAHMGFRGLDPNLTMDTAAMYLAHLMKASRQPEEPPAAFARRVFAHRRRGLRYNLTEACLNMGITVDHEGMHRAAADVTHTQRLFEAVQGVLEPVENWKVVRL